MDNKSVPFIITSDGVVGVPKWKDFIGVDFITVFHKLDESCHCKLINDSIGINGFRHLTMINSIWRIEIICESADAEDVLSKRIVPSDTDWQVMDVFVYHKRRDDPTFPFK